MLTISKPRIGEIAFGKSGVGCPILDVESDRLTLLRADGQKIRVPISAIIRFERPSKHYKIGDRIVFIEGGHFVNGHPYEVVAVGRQGVQIRLAHGKITKFYPFVHIRKVADA